MVHIRASLSQRAFADELGIPLRTYQTYEQDKREPDLRTLKALYERGWNLSWVLLGEGPERLNVLQDNTSQTLRPEELRLAIQLAEEALDGATLGPPDYAELVALIYDALVHGLPSAQVIALARPAARGLKGGSQRHVKPAVGGSS